MKTLHTPGPWFIERRTNDGGTTHHSITASDGHGWSVDRYMSVSGCIDEHDARLIAAAPETLTPRMRITHSMVLAEVEQGGDARARVDQLIDLALQGVQVERRTRRGLDAETQVGRLGAVVPRTHSNAT